LDCGFDRVTVANARTLTEDDAVLVTYMSILADHGADPLNKLADGSVHGMPRGAFSGECKLSDPALVQAQLGYFSLVFAVAANDWQSVAPLARALAAIARVPYDKRKGPGRTRIEVPKAITDARKRFNVVQQLSRFVQGIRYAVPDKLRGGLRPPVSTVIYRVGDCDSRSTLLALLLRAVGIDAGMFVSMKESHAVCAAAVPLPIEPTADANAIRAAVKAWADEMGVSMPLVWAAQPSTTPGAMARDAARSGGAVPEAPQLLLYVPIESTAYTPVGEVSFAEPESWVFLPFSAVWKRVDRTVSADPTDTLGLATDDSERGGVLT
jgi:hypothetical protein